MKQASDRGRPEWRLGERREDGVREMSDGFAPIKGKCNYWRERPVEDDRWDMSVKARDKRIDCSCFVEGKAWECTASTIPSDCPDRLHCRYYIKHE